MIAWLLHLQFPGNFFLLKKESKKIVSRSRQNFDLKNIYTHWINCLAICGFILVACNICSETVCKTSPKSDKAAISGSKPLILSTGSVENQN